MMLNVYWVTERLTKNIANIWIEEGDAGHVMWQEWTISKTARIQRQEN